MKPALAPPEADLTEIDLESDSDHADLTAFTARCAGLEKQIQQVQTLVANLPTHSSSQLQHADDIVAATRKQLAAMAEHNRTLAKDRLIGSASLRIRVTRLNKITRDFTTAVTALEAVRDRRRIIVADSIVEDVIIANPSLNRNDVDDAVHNGNLDTLLHSSDMQLQIQDLHARNRDLKQLTSSIIALKDLFLELGLLAENQQSLINDIEYNVEDVAKNVEGAEEQIVAAEKYKRKLTKKKIIIALIIAAIIAVIVIVVVLQVT